MPPLDFLEQGSASAVGALAPLPRLAVECWLLTAGARRFRG